MRGLPTQTVDEYCQYAKYLDISFALQPNAIRYSTRPIQLCEQLCELDSTRSVNHSAITRTNSHRLIGPKN